METKTKDLIEFGLQYGFHFERFDMEKHDDYAVEILDSHSKYTKVPGLSQRMAVVELYSPNVEWSVWHEPQKVREKPPEAPQMPSIDLRAMQLPLAEIGDFLVGMAKVAGLVVLVVLGGVLVNRTGDLLSSNDIETSVDAALATNIERTTQGGSQFSPANPRQPVGYAIAAVTIILRPFPFEAHAVDQLGVSLEGLGLIVLAALSWRRLLTIPRRLRSDPYVSMALVYILMFIFALGTVGNFGIVSRQRSQVMPFVFVLLSVPAVVPPRKAERDAA